MTATAPIGHIVTVDGVVEKTIDVETNITYQDGWDWSSTGPYIEKAIDDYFKSLSESWDDVNNVVVRISAIEQRILACVGVIDIQDTTLNDATSNLQLNINEIPVRGDVDDGS